MSRKIIIPKGLVNPNETTVIEIPEELSDERELVASPSPCPHECSRGRSNFGNVETVDEENPSPRCYTNTTTEETYSYTDPSVGYSSPFSGGSSYDTNSFGNMNGSGYGCCPPGTNPTPPGRSYNFGRARSPSPAASGRSGNIETSSSYTDTTRSTSGSSRMVKKTSSKTYMRQPMQANTCVKESTTAPKSRNQTYTAMYDSSPFSSGSSYDPNTVSNSYGCTSPDACPNSPGRSYNLGRARSPSPAAPGRFGITETSSSYTDATHSTSGSSRMVKKTSKTYIRKPIQESTNMGNVTCPGAARNRNNILGGLPRDSMSFRSPVAASTPVPRDLTYTAIHDSGPYCTGSCSFGASYPDNNSSRKTNNFGRTQLINPRALSAPARTYNRFPSNLGTTETKTSYTDTTRSTPTSRVVKKSSKTYVRHTTPSSSDMTDSVSRCPGARTADSPWLAGVGHPTDSFGFRSPQAASTPVPRDETYTAIYDSNLFKSDTYESSTFDTNSSSYGGGGRTYNFGRTQSVCPESCTDESGTSNVLGGITPMPQIDSPSMRYPQAASTPVPRDLTYTAMYDSNAFRSGTSYGPDSFGTIDSTYPGGGAGRTFNFGKTQSVCPGGRQSRSTTRIVKKSSKTYIKGPPSRSSGGPPLGTTYSAAPNGGCSPGCSYLQRSSSPKTGPSLVKKTSKTTTNTTNCDGSQMRTSEEVSTIEPSPSGQNQSLMTNIQSRLEDIENTERSRFSNDLRSYQDARRSLMTNTTYTFGERNADTSPARKHQCGASCPSRGK